MKKIIIIVAILVAVVIAGAIIASIMLQPEEIRLSGTYSNEVLETGGTLMFDDEKVVATYRSAGYEVYTVTGTYTIAEGMLIMTFNDESVAHNVFEGQFKFEFGDGDFIWIDDIKYYNVDTNKSEQSS